jgi:hypothetical protein
MKRTRLNLEPLESRQMMAVWSPGLRISDATVDEGGLATLTVTRDNISYLSASVKWATASGSAGASDYAGASGTLKFGSRELSKTITIPTKEDTLVEGLESFVVNLTSAKYGTIKDKQGTACRNHHLLAVTRSRTEIRGSTRHGPGARQRATPHPKQRQRRRSHHSRRSPCFRVGSLGHAR